MFNWSAWVGQGSGQSRSTASVAVGIARTICLLLLGYLPASPQTAPPNHASILPVSRPDILFVQTPVLLSSPLAHRFPKGSSLVRLNNATASGGLLHLTDEFFAAADPQLNFEADKILFSGQKNKSDRWQLWEMNLDGSHKRQVTQCPADCLRGAYLPADEIAFTVEESQGPQRHSYLAVVKTDGSGFHPITFGNAPFQLETVLRDGRIVASAPWPLLEASEPSTSRLLYTLRPDGTALESFRCNHSEKAIQADAEELADGSLLFLRKSSPGASTGGKLMRIAQGAPGATSFGPSQALYQSPRQLSESDLVIARQTLTATNSAGRFDLFLLNVKTGALGVRLYTDPQLSSIQPVPVLQRTVPKHYWNTLNLELSTGNFISLDSYVSSDVPHGRISTPISQVRVFSLNPADGKQHSLGDAPVEADGSFFVKVPANSPIRFALLDAKGQIIREERSWIWTRPGEQRGCTGCHGDKAVVPENHWPQTLRRFDTPTPLGEIDHGSATSQAK